MNKKQSTVVCLTLILLLIMSPVFAEDGSYDSTIADGGTYDATVTTDSGSYSVPVEVESGEVTQVHWPNCGNMTVSGAEISAGEATGVNSRGDPVSIELEDYNDD